MIDLVSSCRKGKYKQGTVLDVENSVLIQALEALVKQSVLELSIWDILLRKPTAKID